MDQRVIESLAARLAELKAEAAGLRSAIESVTKMIPDADRLTAKEIAPFLGVTHPKTIERWVRERGLPCKRNGRNLRFVLGDVLQWRAQQER